MTTIFKLKGADFSSQGLPSVYPYVSPINALFAYDFRKRPNRLEDLTGKNSPMVPWKNDLFRSIRKIDQTMLKDSPDGGVTLENGFLTSESLLIKPIPADGSEHFTVMVAGGWSGERQPSEEYMPAGTSSSSIASLFDFGTGISANGFALEATNIGIGARIVSGGFALDDSISSPTSYAVTFLSFDGETWTLRNKTLNTTHSKTVTEMGLNRPIGVSGTMPTATIGHFHKASTLAGRYPTMFQLMKWDKVLTENEIQDQYTRTRFAFPDANL